MIENQPPLNNPTIPYLNPPIATPPVSPLPTPAKKIISKTQILLLLVAILLIISMTLNFFQYNGFFLNSGVFSTQNIRALPISPQKPFIKSSGMSYYVETKIREIKDGPNGPEFVTDIQDPSFPPIYVQPRTLLYTNTDGDEVFDITKINTFKPGQKIGIFMIYSNFKEWMIVRITLLSS